MLIRMCSSCAVSPDRRTGLRADMRDPWRAHPAATIHETDSCSRFTQKLAHTTTTMRNRIGDHETEERTYSSSILAAIACKKERTQLKRGLCRGHHQFAEALSEL